ncbi:MAG: 3-coathanger stack domain-containing protein, partial [Bacteroidota bacterium]
QSITDIGPAIPTISNGLIDGNDCRQIALAPSDGNYIYVTKPNNLYRSTDGGTTWDDITNTLPVGIGSRLTYVAVHPTDPDQVWVTMGGFVRSTINGYNIGNKVFFSDDGGDTWENISDNLPNLPANCIIYENGSNDGIYVGMDVGVWYRDNTMDEWVLFSNGLPNVIIAELEINYTTGKLHAGTFGRGAWSTDLFSACNPICLDCPDFTEIHSLSNKYSSESCITSSSQVYDETDVIYSAEDYIHLQDNFHVQSMQEGTFHGLIDECDPGPGFMLANFANVREIPGYYAGELPGAVQLQSTEEAGREWNGASTETVQIHAFPNPTYAEINLEAELLVAGDLSIMVYDILGNAVRLLEADLPVEAGNYRQGYDLTELAGGTYLIEMKLNDQRYYQTFIKLSY